MKLLEMFPNLLPMLDAQCWTEFVSTHTQFVPQLVQEFYHNLQVVDRQTYSVVQGIVIRLDARLLHKALQIPGHGAAFNP